MLDPRTVDQMLARSHAMGLGDPDEGEQASAHHKVGHRVKTPKGHGTVASVHHNTTFYGVHVGGGVSFFPSTQVNDPDHDGDNDSPGGAGDTDHDAPA